MIYGLRRMIYRALHGMIYYPFLHTPQAYIIRDSGYHTVGISSVPTRNGYHCKRASRNAMLFCMVEATGIEPVSEDPLTRFSPGAVYLWYFPRAEPINGIGVR